MPCVVSRDSPATLGGLAIPGALEKIQIPGSHLTKQNLREGRT